MRTQKTARYLVTGGAGFIGSHIAETLLAQGESVRILDNLSTGKETHLDSVKSNPRLDFMRGDIRDIHAVRTAMQGIEVVFHQAALASVPRSIADPIASLETNVNGTQNVLLAARDAGARRVVYASSSSVYGNTPVLPKEESMQPHPLSPYAMQKLAGEHLCSVFSHIFGLETVALRYFNVFGPRQDPASQYAAVIPRFLTALLEGQAPVVFGDGEQTRDFTYVGNVVQANLLAACAPAAAGRVINIGCGERISLNCVLQFASSLLETSVQARYAEARAGDVKDSLADIRLARELLGYEPSIRFQQGLAATLNAFQESRQAASASPERDWWLP